ncbi:signal recognition particle 54 kDa protein 2 [Panicum miliaceum]|uniref:signal-recognition-particle GTPase n=1 Tax=Panicum miliaceum TaxID=4540 RepID=A0A3L6SLP2_PANMI|nr:signal recognition particle 54 kDa protein 2 [Panicum miliaceum]
MVLAQLGGSISRALAQMSNATVIDEKVLNDCLNEISRALLQSDVQFKMVRDMQTNIKRIVNLEALAAGTNKRRIMQQAVFTELCNMLDPGKPSFTPKKGKPSVVMFVGLQAHNDVHSGLGHRLTASNPTHKLKAVKPLLVSGSSGKTTTCTKYAYYHQRKGFKPALVCADTFRAGAFDQLKQNATKAKIPFYGSYMESDPVKIAVEGVERFKKENCDLIIVDTSGRHKQEAALFEEMRQVSEATKPDLVIFVMDSSIGQAAFDQAQAFKQSVSVGAVIITKMDGHAKGGGALSAVAATKSPVIFIGTGEHIDEFEVFDVKPFVSRLLGMGDWSGFMDKIHEVVPTDQQPELLQKLSEGSFTLRLMYEQFQNILKMGPIGQVFSMLPGFSAELMPKGHEKESQAKIKRYMTMMDSMTDAELDSTNPKLMTESRIIRIARGSGRPVRDVMDMLEEYKRLAKIWGKMKGLKIPKKGEMSALSRNMNVQHMSKVLPPQMLKQIGGMGGLQSLMKQMGSKEMSGMFGGMGGDRLPKKRRCKNAYGVLSFNYTALRPKRAPSPFQSPPAVDEMSVTGLQHGHGHGGAIVGVRLAQLQHDGQHRGRASPAMSAAPDRLHSPTHDTKSVRDAPAAESCHGETRGPRNDPTWRGSEKKTHHPFFGLGVVGLPAVRVHDDRLARRLSDREDEPVDQAGRCSSLGLSHRRALGDRVAAEPLAARWHRPWK